MTCESSKSLLHGYLDGELDAARAQEFERHLENCSQCTVQLEEQEALRNSLHMAKLYERAPAKLTAKIKRQIKTMQSDEQWSWVPIWRWVAASALIVALIVTSYVTAQKLYARFSGDESVGVTEVIDAHVRSLQPGHMTDVASTDQHTVKPWFDGKLDYVPPVRDLAEQEFPLVGGRLDILEGRTVAALVYGRRKHFISVYAWPAKGSELKLPDSGSRNGYQWLTWNASGMKFCAVSDVSEADLQTLAGLLQK